MRDHHLTLTHLLMKEEDSSSLWKWYIIIIIISNVYILLLLLLLLLCFSNVYILLLLLLLLLLFPSLVWKFNFYLSDLQHLAILSSFVNFQFTIYNLQWFSTAQNTYRVNLNVIAKDSISRPRELYVQTKRVCTHH